MLLPARHFDRGLALAIAGLTAANLAWTTWCLGGYRPETLAVSSPLLLATLAAAWVFSSRRGGRDGLPRWVLGTPLPFLLYAVWQTTQHSPVPWLGFFDASLWLQGAAAFWIGLSIFGHPEARRWIWISVGGIMIMGAVAAMYQRWIDPEWLPMGRRQAAQFLTRSSGVLGIPNTLAAMALLVVPPAFALAKRSPTRAGRCFAASVALAGTIALVLTISRSAWLSLGLAALVAPWLARNEPVKHRLRHTGVAVAALAFVALAILATPSARARFAALQADGGEPTRRIMWMMSWRLFQEKPMLGTGGGSYRVVLERHRPVGFRDDPKWAHNEYLNTLSDYGLLGFSLSFGVIAVAAGVIVFSQHRRSPARPEDGWARGLELGLIAFAVSLWFDFHLKIPALAMLVGLSAAQWVHLMCRHRDGRAAPLARVAWSSRLGAAAALVLAIVNTPRWWAEGIRYQARQSIDRLADRGNAAEAAADFRLLVRQFERASRIDPANAQTWSDLSLALVQLAHAPAVDRLTLGQQAEAAARRALGSSDSVSQFWVHLGLALDLQQRWPEAGRAFARAVELAPHHALGWYYQADHYSRAPATRSLARAAVKTCLTLDPWHPQALALQERLLAE